MNRSKLVAIITGIISILLAIAYLIIVQILDFRGEMQPAPVSQLEQVPLVVTNLECGQESQQHQSTYCYQQFDT